MNSRELVDVRFSGCWPCHQLTYATIATGTASKIKQPVLGFVANSPTRSPATHPMKSNPSMLARRFSSAIEH